MSDPSLTLRQADESDLSYVERLLDANDLPSRDVRSKPGCFYVGYHGDERVGTGGLEIRGSDGLLRSLVVEESARGRGFGRAICEALETKAREEGVETLYLLTTTIPSFFASHGYAAIDRADAPAGIRQTTEFDDLCPATATCLAKSLTR